jgi:hypothetical protein
MNSKSIPKTDAELPTATNKELITFKVTKYELFVLATHWQRIWYDDHFALFCDEESRCDHKIMEMYYERKIQIAAALGGWDLVHAAGRQAISELEKLHHPRFVELFLSDMYDYSD